MVSCSCTKDFGRVFTKKMSIIQECFRREICSNWKTIDPDEERYWYDMSIGYFLAKGLNIDEATTLACHVRYCEHYWGKA